MSSQDKVALSARERQELAKLQSLLESADPGLAKKLARHEHRPTVRWQEIAQAAGHRLSLLADRHWVGPLVSVVGLAVMVVAVASALWAAVLAALVVVVGLALCFTDLQRVVDGRAGARGPEPGEGQANI